MSTTHSCPTLLTEFHVETSRLSPTIASVTLIGEIDLANSDLLRFWLLALLGDGLPRLSRSTSPGFPSWTAPAALVAVRKVLEVTGMLGLLAAPTIQPQPLAMTETAQGPGSALSAHIHLVGLM